MLYNFRNFPGVMDGQNREPEMSVNQVFMGQPVDSNVRSLALTILQRLQVVWMILRYS